MEPKTEPVEQIFLPDYKNYVLPPTPSGSSTDTAHSPSYSDHGGQKMNFYCDHYSTHLTDMPAGEQSGDSQQDKIILNHQSNNLHLGAFPLYQPVVQHPGINEWIKPKYQPGLSLPSDPCPNQVIPSEQLPDPLTPSSSTFADDQVQETRTHKRLRTKYSSVQIAEMEKAYRTSQYLTKVQKVELSKKLNLDEVRIKVWYQNRRMKDKKLGLKEKTLNKNEKAIWFAETAKLLDDNSPIYIKQENETSPASESVTNRLLNHSVWAKAYPSISPALTNYLSCIPNNNYHWNHASGPYSSNLHSAAIPVPTSYLNQYEQQYNTEYLNPHPSYQYNLPQLPTNVKDEDKNCENGTSLQEDFNFAVAQEFLAKTPPF